MRPVELLIVGAGSRGMAFGDYARRHPDEARVVAVAEPRPVARNRLGDEHAIAQRRRYRDWRDAIEAADLPEAVVIATLDRDHLEPAVALSARGCALLIEKPLAPTEAECRTLAGAVTASGVVAAVAHVLRYTAYTRLLEAVLAEGAIGEIVSIQHLEPVGFHHQAHAYVRGNWRREDETGPMLLAKCCHDLDWLSHLIGRPCLEVASFGSLRHFRAQERPPGAGERCLECPIEPSCAFSARRAYVDAARNGHTGWPVDVVAWPPTVANLEAALRDGPYGRCVWACDNDVVDHQVVALRYEGDVTATLTMTAFTRMRDRETRIFGTRGELTGDGARIRVYDPACDAETIWEVPSPTDGTILSGHGGGDDGVMAAFLAAVRAGDPSALATTPVNALESHAIAFAAERARREGRVVAL